MNDLADLNMILYHDNYPIAACRPEYLGFMGVYFKNIVLNYPIGTDLDIHFTGYEDKGSIKDRLPMVVNKSGVDGTGLRLKSFEKESISKWMSLLQSMGYPCGDKNISVYN